MLSRLQKDRLIEAADRLYTRLVVVALFGALLVAPHYIGALAVCKACGQ